MFQRTSIRNIDYRKEGVLYNDIPFKIKRDWSSCVDFEQIGRLSICTPLLIRKHIFLIDLKWAFRHEGASLPACVALALRSLGLKNNTSAARRLIQSMYKEFMT